MKDPETDRPKVDALLHLKSITLFKGVAPDNLAAEKQFWPALGIDLNIVGERPERPAWVENALRLTRALESEGPERVVEELSNTSASDVEKTLIGLLAQGELEYANQLFSLAMDVLGPSGALLFQRGVAALMAGDADEAESWYRKAIASDEPFDMAYCNLSAVLLDKGDIEGAREMADKAMEVMPDDPLGLRNAISVEVVSGDLAGALALLETHGDVLPENERNGMKAMLSDSGFELPKREVRHSFPLHHELMLELGRMLIDEQQPAEALNPLERAIELDPARVEARADLGYALSLLDRDEDALAVYAEGIEQAMGGELLRFNRGNALQRLGRHDEAIEDYERCCELMPSWPHPRINLISTLQERDRIEEARKHFSKLEEMDVSDDTIDALREQLDRD